MHKPLSKFLSTIIRERQECYAANACRPKTKLNLPKTRMTWNYRVVKTQDGYSVYEVFYDDAGNPSGCTTNPILDFFCDTPEALLEELEIIRHAFETVPLDISEIGTKNGDLPI
jgi:hypothetical protein